jgi:hypothetical protein
MAILGVIDAENFLPTTKICWTIPLDAIFKLKYKDSSVDLKLKKKKLALIP